MEWQACRHNVNDRAKDPGAAVAYSPGNLNNPRKSPLRWPRWRSSWAAGRGGTSLQEWGRCPALSVQGRSPRGAYGRTGAGLRRTGGRTARSARTCAEVLGRGGWVDCRTGGKFLLLRFIGTTSHCRFRCAVCSSEITRRGGHFWPLRMPRAPARPPRRARPCARARPSVGLPG